MNAEVITKEHNTDKLLLAKNLSNLLDNHPLNINQIADALDIPSMTIRRLINGETINPTIHTLKLLADYLNVSLDTLINNNITELSPESYTAKSRFLPILDWETATLTNSKQPIDLSQWKMWQSFSIDQKIQLSKQAFAIKSKPSMQPRYPHNSIFVIDPLAAPEDGDTVLVKIKANHDITLRELMIDAPEWQLHPIIPGSTPLLFSSVDHEIIGVNILTLLYNRK